MLKLAGGCILWSKLYDDADLCVAAEAAENITVTTQCHTHYSCFF